MANCLCGSGKIYEACCGRFIEGGEFASTAEELLRSRYVAHANKTIQYIINTVHETNQEDANRESLKSWLDKTTWRGLNIIDIDIKSDDVTFIDFEAIAEFDGKTETHREVSEFRKEDGKWLFYKGITPNVKQVINENKNVKANDKCPCGSGKKYKKCCMNK